MNLSSEEEDKNIKFLEVPDELKPYVEEFEKTAKDAIEIELVHKKETLPPWKSKLGGIPYLPLNEKYPCDPKGNKLAFFAQINFSEMPYLDGYPTKGILVFFVDLYNSAIYSEKYADFTNQDWFRVLYFTDVHEDEKMLNNELDEVDREFLLPFDPKNEWLLEFKQIKQYLPCTDYRSEDLEIFEHWDLLWRTYGERMDNEKDVIGGWYFSYAQWDTKNNNRYLGYESLLHIKSDHYYEYTGEDMWGEGGSANFMIKPEDLAKRDFTKVLFMWAPY